MQRVDTCCAQGAGGGKKMNRHPKKQMKWYIKWSIRIVTFPIWLIVLVTYGMMLLVDIMFEVWDAN